MNNCSILQNKKTIWQIISFWVLQGRYLIPFLLTLLASELQAQEVNLNKKNTPLVEILHEIESQTEISFVYNTGQIDLNQNTSVNWNNLSVDEALKNLFFNTGISYRRQENRVILLPDNDNSNHNNTEKLKVKISGKVTDAVTKDPLIGVSILIKGTTTGEVTDLSGNFNIEAYASDTLLVSYVGYTTQKININNQTLFDISMNTDLTNFDEVVVIGYGTMKKANLTGAVDQIDSKVLDNTPVGGIGEALQGQIPNVIIDIADGKPGREADINIRGETSINGGDPLILVDGVPTSNFNTIPTQDIESISVLKDAAASAIYGGRAAFGVILITTKKASDEKFSVDYSGSFSLSSPTIVPDVYTGLDYMEVQEEFAENIDQTFFTDAQIDYANQVAIDPSLPHAKYEDGMLYCGGEVHNYYDEWFSDYTPKTQHHLALSSSGNKLQMYTSADYSHIKGPLKLHPTQIDKYYIRTNLKYKISNNLTIQNNTSYTLKNSDIPDTKIYSFRSNIFRFLDITWPMMPEYVDVDGESVATNFGWWREYLGEKSFRYETWDDFYNTTSFDWAPFGKLLSIHGDYSYEKANWDKERYRNNKGTFIDNSTTNSNNIVDEHSKFTSEYYLSNYYTNRHVINIYGSSEYTIKDHTFKALVGFNQEDYTYNKYWAETTDPLNLTAVQSLTLSTGEVTNGDDYDSYALRSTFCRLNYSYNNRYLLEMNGTYFLSSKFSKENRGSVEPSFSAGWVVSKEGFFTPLLSKVNFLKLRGSYGSLGNQDIGSFDYLEIMGTGTLDYLLDDETTSYVSNPDPISSNYTWEKATTVDGGVDINFFSNKLKLTFDYYNRITSGMLAESYSLPSVYGADTPEENNATLKTVGWELSLSYGKQTSLASKPFNFYVRATVSDNKSKITKYLNETGYLDDYYSGMEIGEIWGLTTLGLFESDDEAAEWPTSSSFWGNKKGGGMLAGDLKFEDKDGDGEISEGDWTLDDHGDYSKIGNSSPRYNFGITTSFSWDGFDFNMFINGIGKRDLYPESETNNFWSAYNRKYSTLLTHVVENSWTEDNPDAYFPRRRGYIAQGGYELDIPQTRYLLNAAYLRIKNLTLGYTFPSALTQRCKINKLRIYFNGQNLWELSALRKYYLDPEGLEEDPDASSSYVGNGTAYSINRTYSFGLQASF